MILVLLIIVLVSGSRVNWLQAVITALFAPTIGIVVPAWRMHQRSQQPGPDDFLQG